MPLVDIQSHAVQTLATYALIAVWEGRVDPSKEELLETFLFEHMEEYGHGHKSTTTQWYLIDAACAAARMWIVAQAKGRGAIGRYPRAEAKG